MERIETIEELINELNASEPEAFVKIAKRLNIPISEFKRYTFWKSDDYTRNCIERTSKYELLLLCWAPGGETSIHGHNEQRCWVHQVDGTMVETRYAMDEEGKLEETNELTLTPGKLSFMRDEMGYHSLKNNSDVGAMTLHLYISPIDICDSYDEDSKEFMATPLHYDSFKGVLSESYSSV
jgi:cysteine dioxygenase